MDLGGIFEKDQGEIHSKFSSWKIHWIEKMLGIGKKKNNSFGWGIFFGKNLLWCI